jgi:hypothetical protein
MLGSG